MEPDQPRKTPVAFYQTPAGRSAVLDWLRGLPEGERAAIGQDLMRVQFRWPVGTPLCRPLSDCLWELRGDCPGNRIARLLLCLVDRRLVVLRGFIKKTQKTPDND